METEPQTPRLKESDEYYRYIVDSISNYAIFMLDPYGNVLIWSEGAKACLGYEKAEVLGKNFSLFYPPEDLVASKPGLALQRAMEIGRFEEEGWWLRQDGSRFWAHLTLSKLQNRTGEHLGFAIVIRDFSERRRRDEELRKSQQRYETLTTGTKEGIFEHDLMNGEMYVSPTCKQLLGFPENQIVTWADWSRQIQSDDLIEVLKRRQASINLELLDYNIEYRYILPLTAEERWMQAKIHVVRDPQGLAVSLIGSLSDVTAKKSAEEALRKSEAKMRELMLLVPVGIYQTNEVGQYIYVNQRWSEMTGRASSAALGSGWLDSVHSEDRDRVAREWEKAVHAGHVFSANYLYQRADGSTGWVIGTSVPLRQKEDLGSGYLGVVQDITALKVAEQNLLQSAKMSSLGQMAGGIAHEINNPLAIIAMKIEQAKLRLKREPVPAAEVTVDLERIQETANRIAKIVRGLRTFSREGERDPMSIVKASALINDTVELCRDKFTQKAVLLKMNLDADGELECRPSQISQVLLNVLLNAIDALELLSERWVNVRTANTGDLLEISIVDSGNGISEDVQEKMMIPFFTTKEVGKGTGLGLSISKGIMDAHHGRLYYDPVSPHTRFVIELPWRQPPA